METQIRVTVTLAMNPSRESTKGTEQGLVCGSMSVPFWFNTYVRRATMSPLLVTSITQVEKFLAALLFIDNNGSLSEASTECEVRDRVQSSSET